MRMAVWLITTVLTIAPRVDAGELYSVSPTDGLIRRLDAATGATLGSPMPITLPDRLVAKGRGLATHPQTGQMWGLVDTPACADPSRTSVVARCTELDGDQAGCNAAATVDERNLAASCYWAPADAACRPCDYGQDDATCTDTCFTRPQCADSSRTHFAPAGCGTRADPTSCTQAYSIGRCGIESCYWGAFGCEECGPSAQYLDGACTNTCGEFETLDATTLVEIAPATGVASNPIELSSRVQSLAFTCNGSAYTLTGYSCQEDDPIPGTTMRLDPVDGLVTVDPFIGTLTSDQTLAFNPDDGFMYQASTNGLRHFHIGDEYARLISTLDPLLHLRPVGAFTWSTADHAFVWVNGYSGSESFLQVTATGAATIRGDVDHHVTGLAFTGEVAACIVCGDGVVAGTEECDDGGDVMNHCCSADCTIPRAGVSAVFCAAGTIQDPEICGADPVDAKIAWLLLKRGDKLMALAAALRDTGGTPKRVRKLTTHMSATLKALRRKTTKSARAGTITDACAATLATKYDELAALIAGLAP